MILRKNKQQFGVLNNEEIGLLIVGNIEAIGHPIYQET